MRTALRFARPLCRRHWFPNTAFFTVPCLYSLSPAPFLPPPARSPARYFLSCPYQAGHLIHPTGRSFPLIPALSGTPLPLQFLYFQAVLLRFPDAPHTGRGYRQTFFYLIVQTSDVPVDVCPQRHMVRPFPLQGDDKFLAEGAVRRLHCKLR